jgi:hypothetical protein
VRPVSPHHLAVVLDQKALESLASAETGEWSLHSADDPHYAQKTRPVDTALRLKSQRLIPEGWPFKSVVGGEALLQ